jgi:hypothetical protein
LEAIVGNEAMNTNEDWSGIELELRVALMMLGKNHRARILYAAGKMRQFLAWIFFADRRNNYATKASQSERKGRKKKKLKERDIPKNSRQKREEKVSVWRKNPCTWFAVVLFVCF